MSRRPLPGARAFIAFLVLCSAPSREAAFAQSRTSPFPASRAPRALPVEEKKPSPPRTAPRPAAATKPTTATKRVPPPADPPAEDTEGTDLEPVAPKRSSSADDDKPSTTTTTPKPKAAPLDDDDIPEGKPVPKDAASIVPREEAIPEGRPIPEGAVTPSNPALPQEPPLQASMRTQADARTLYVTLPAPRGLIVDRNGHPLAQNIVAYYPGIQFPEGPPLKPQDALAYAKQRIAIANKVLGEPWDVKDEDILKHYENRRWLPLLNERVLKTAPTEDQKSRLLAGTILHPAYLRTYPEGKTACHILGSVGKVRPMPTGTLDPQDPFYPEMIGRDGLEAAFEEKLKGTAGQMNMLFDGQGHKIGEEITHHPVPGLTLVTTLDLDFQQICEDVLRSNVKRGAFVIMDVETGDVIALASWPTFDPNSFVPSIPQAEYNSLLKDKDKPLIGRAFMGVYPPASTFKVVTALAGLDSGKFGENSAFNCSATLRLGKHILRNAYKGDFGSIGLTQAIKISCNTWFARAGMATGAANLTNMANRLGYGERTGLPIKGEAAGRVADDDWMMINYGRKILQGDLANMSIGQGALSATPLQVARGMAAVANGQFTPQARLVAQIQDLDDQVVEAFLPAPRNDLNISKRNINAVHKGMRAVVNDGGGTGRAAACRYVTVAGKTGTAQWGPDRNMAWFAGFLPANNPQYAFAAIYEGDYGESSISGGKKVAPMVKTVFDRIYKLKKDRDEPFYKRSADSLLAKRDAEKGSRDEEDEDEDSDAESRPPTKPRVAATVAKPAAEEPAPAPAPADKGVRGFFKKLFGNRER
jgi:penicillin-binding protein 2